MLHAHANMPIEDFIAQLRTYVIAMDLSPQVVDCVDKLAGAEKTEKRHALELQEAEEEAERCGRESIKNEIIDAVGLWADESLGPETKGLLLTVIENV